MKGVQKKILTYFDEQFCIQKKIDGQMLSPTKKKRLSRRLKLLTAKIDKFQATLDQSAEF